MLQVCVAELGIQKTGVFLESVLLFQWPARLG